MHLTKMLHFLKNDPHLTKTIENAGKVFKM